MSTTTIGKVAYIATWDASQLVKGVMTSRQQFSAQKKIIESLKSPLERYVTGLENLQAIVKKYPEVARHQLKLEQNLERQYLAEANAIRALSTEESKRLKILNYASGQRAADGVARRSPAELKAENDRMNRERGLAEQERIRRYTAAVAREAEIGRRGLSERLKLYKAEKAANEKHTRDLQHEFNKRMRAEDLAVRKRARLVNVTKANALNPRFAAGGLGSAIGGAGHAAMGSLGATIGLAVAGGPIAALALLAKAAIPLHARIERSQAAMEVFTGTTARAASMMQRMRDLSAESGVGFEAMQNGVSTMMSFGVSINRVLPAMRQMAEITRGDTERLGSLSLAFAQSAAAGKLMGQDLLQMVNAGFNPLQEISRKTGISLSDLRKQMERGQISFDMVANAFRTATAEGGKFHGMMEKIGETSAGSISRVSAEWSVFLDKFGESIAPATKVGASTLSSSLSILSSVFSKWDDAIDRRMKAAKKSAGMSIMNDRSIFGSQFELSRLAVINNELDARIEKYKKKHEAFSKMQQKPMSAAASMPSPTQAGQSEIYRLQVELGLVDKIAVRRKQLIDNGLNNVEIQRVMHMERQLELIEKQKKASEEMDASRKEAMDKMQDRGRQLMKDLRSPMESLRAELSDLILLRRNGAIDDRTMMAGANAAAGRMPVDSPKSASSLPPAMRAGSAELYSYLAENQARLNRPKVDDKEQIQTRLQGILNDLMRENNRTLASIRDGLPKFGSDG